MLRKSISILIVALLLCSNMSLIFANGLSDMAVLDKVALVEKFFEGTEQTGPLVERIGKLEKEIWGKEDKGSLVARTDKLYAYCRVNSESEPSFLIKMNAVEWTLTNKVTTEPVKLRIENLERVLNGNVVAGPFDDRLNQMIKYAYVDGVVTLTGVTVDKDNLLKIKLITPLSTRTSRPGDVVAFEIEEDVYIDGSLILAKGAQGKGKVNKVEGSKNFGRDAQMEVSFDTVEAIDGSIINTLLGDKAKEENKSVAMAAGASLAGMVILGPIGIVGGAFVHGKEVTIPAGTNIYIQTQETSSLYGI